MNEPSLAQVEAGALALTQVPEFALWNANSYTREEVAAAILYAALNAEEDSRCA